MSDDKTIPVHPVPPLEKQQFTRKPRSEPIVVRAVVLREEPSPEDVLRELLTEDQAELERWRQRKGETE